jgi:hypothetical protein
MIGIQLEFASEYRCLLGIFFQRGSEILDEEKREFTEVAIGLIFIYFRIAKYKKKEGA